jgi:hypothetical protein
MTTWRGADWSWSTAWRAACLGLAMTMGTAGCSGDKSVPGGTKGRVTVDGQPWPEIQVTVYRNESNDSLKLGFGVTREGGLVELLAEDAEGPLWLTPGEYVVTAESIGPPLKIAPDCHDDRKSPLRLIIADGEPFTLDVPTHKRRTGTTRQGPT